MSVDKKVFWKYADSYDFMEKVRTGMPPVIIVCACNGGIQGKEYNESIPETSDEIADSVEEAYRAGAAMVHVHARDPKNITSGAVRTETWHEVNKKIRERCPDIIINNTTGASFGMTMEERLSCLDAKPEVASLNLTPDMSKFKLKERKSPLPYPRREKEFDECIPFTFGLITKFAAEMKKRNIKPEIEIYHTGGNYVARELVEQKLVEPPFWIQTVMGYQSASTPSPNSVLHLLRELPDNTLWLCSGIGPFQLPMTTLAILLGGHVRVGLEDNTYYKRGEKAKSNAQLVERAARIAQELNRGVATPAQARTMLGLSATPTKYV